jgi:hypothetical protein
MGAEEMAHANWRLDNPPVVDVAVSRRMGLFVVARLAARHGIHVRLRPASKGGLTALVWLPDEVVTREAPDSVVDLRPLGAASPAATTPWMETGLAVEGTDEPPAGPQLARDVRPRRTAAAYPVPSQPGPSHSGPGQFAAGDATRSRSEDQAARPVPSANGTALSPGIASPGPARAGRDVVIPPVESTGPASRLPIFESVESDWFRRGGRPVSRTASLPEPENAGWSSPADAGWQAAEVARAPVFADTTEAGLPKRVPKANLVPGGAGPAAPVPPVPGRSASQTRQRLSSFQQGIRKARGTAPGDDTDLGDEADRAS